MKPETFKLIRDGNGPKGDVMGPRASPALWRPRAQRN